MGTTSFSHQRRLPTTHAHRGMQQHTATHSGVNTGIPSYASTNLVAPVWSRASQSMPSYTPVLQGNNALEERRAHTRRSIPPTARSATVRATQRRISSLRALTARRELILTAVLEFLAIFRFSLESHFLLFPIFLRRRKAPAPLIRDQGFYMI